jgi:sigma-E factor negative regulatory protein RseA
VAASFVVIAGAAVLLSRGPADVPVATASVAPVAPAPDRQAAPMVVADEPQALVASGKLIRDARLDRYLAAHKQFAGSSALGVPSGYLRNATAIEGDR